MLNLFFYIFFRKEEPIVIDLYCALIINSKRNFVSIPVRYKEAVKEQLLGIGLDENGDVLQ